MPSGKPSGRPRRLALAAIVDAACQIGIDQLEMSLLAKRLDTGVATLYGYVRSRDHLLELMAPRLASMALPIEIGQDWRDVLRSHAALCYSVFQSQPELIGNLIAGEDNDEEIAYGRRLVSMLEAGGLTHDDAAETYAETNQAVIGAAVMRLRRDLIARNMDDETGAPIQLPAVLGDYRPAMERIIRDQEIRCRRADRPVGATDPHLD